MMEEALQIQIFAIVMLFMVSLIGMSMPLMLLTENDRKIFPYFNSLAAGVMIGLSMVSVFVCKVILVRALTALLV